MLYYKAKVADRVYRFNGYLQTIGGELYTPAEVAKYSTPDKYGCRMKPEWLEPVNVSKRNIYWFFGARFGKEG